MDQENITSYVWNSGGNTMIVCFDNVETGQSLSISDEIAFLVDILSEEYWDIFDDEEEQKHVLREAILKQENEIGLQLAVLIEGTGFLLVDVVELWEETFNF